MGKEGRLVGSGGAGEQKEKKWYARAGAGITGEQGCVKGAGRGPWLKVSNIFDAGS